MGLDQLNKQQKILLYYVLPGFILIIIFVSGYFFTLADKEEENKNKGTIDTSLPTSNSNIQSDKNSAYQKEEQYKKDHRRGSDFMIGNYAVLAENEKEIEKQPDTIHVKEKEEKEPQKRSQTGRVNNLQKTRRELIAQQKTLESFDGDEIYDDRKIKRARDQQIEEKNTATLPVKQGITFNSIILAKKGTDSQSNTNGSVAFIHGDQTVRHGSVVKIRTGKEMMLSGNQKIPPHSFMYGICAIVGERININIMRVQSGSNIINCNLLCYGTDGNIGIYIPGSVQKDEGKKSSGKGLKKVSSILGSGVSIASGGILGDLAGTIAEGTIDAIADGSTKSIQQIKVFLPNNEKIFIK